MSIWCAPVKIAHSFRDSPIGRRRWRVSASSAGSDFPRVLPSFRAEITRMVCAQIGDNIAVVCGFAARVDIRDDASK